MDRSEISTGLTSYNQPIEGTDYVHVTNYQFDPNQLAQANPEQATNPGLLKAMGYLALFENAGISIRLGRPYENGKPVDVDYDPAVDSPTGIYVKEEHLALYEQRKQDFENSGDQRPDEEVLAALAAEDSYFTKEFLGL